MSSRHACRRMPSGIRIGSEGAGWRISLTRSGVSWVREIAYCSWCGLKLGTARASKASAAKGAARNAKAVRCVETGEVFRSQAAAAEWAGCTQPTLSEACRGKRETAGGHRWEFA